MTRLARELGVSVVSVSLWFRGQVKSERLDRAIRARAAELLEQEQADDEARRAA